MIHEWWWQALGALLFLGLSAATFLNLYEIEIVKENKEKLPNGNWTVSTAGKTICYLNYSTFRQEQQRRIS